MKNQCGKALKSLPAVWLLFQEKPYHFFTDLPIRLIPHRKIDPGLFIYDALIMGKRVKSRLSVVGAHSAFSESAESHFCSSQMNDCIINASAAEAAAGEYLCRRFFIGGEDVEGQGMGHGIDFMDHLIQMVKYQDRHNGAENFFLHNRIGEGDIVQDGRLNTEAFPVCLSAVHKLILIHQSQKPVKMLFVDDLSIIWIVKGLSAVLLLDLFLDLFYQPVLYRTMAVHVIRRYAGLPAV